MSLLPFPIVDDPGATTFVVDAQWWLADPVALDRAVYRRDGLNQAVEVDPRAPLDLVADRLSLGHYQADVSAVVTPGRYFVRWFATVEAGGDEVTWDGADYEVLTDGPATNVPGRRYALVDDLRAEGLPASVSDSRALLALTVASRQIEQYTGRTFGADAKRLQVDIFSGNNAILVEQAIVAMGNIYLVNVDIDEDLLTQIERDLVRIYNRHLSQRMLSPDDRADPRLELRWDTVGLSPGVPMTSRNLLRWSRGRQDVRLEGAFGYTEPDGSPMGRVPALIKQATILLALGRAGLLNAASGGGGVGAGTIKREKTRDQEVEYETGGGESGSVFTGAFTGDPAIDTIIAMYRRPPRFGAA